jgi:hypothetical protein
MFDRSYPVSLDDPRPAWVFAGYADANAERRILWPHTCLDQLAALPADETNPAPKGYIVLNEIAGHAQHAEGRYWMGTCKRCFVIVWTCLDDSRDDGDDEQAGAGDPRPHARGVSDMLASISPDFACPPS